MKATFERIDLGINKSFKVSTYVDKDADECGIKGWHIHPEYEIVYIKNGWGRLEIDNRSKVYEDGVLLFLGPQIPHIGFGNTELPDNLEVVVQFNENFIKDRIAGFPEFKHVLKLIDHAKKGIIYSHDIKTKLASLFEKFSTLNDTEKLVNLIEILGKLAGSDDFEYVSENLRLYDFNSVELERLQIIFDYVNLNFNVSFSTKDVAESIGLTTNSFCRFFKKVTKQTFTQFVNEFRVRKAVELLGNGKLSISQVMYSSGFNDPSYFTRQFKKYTGKTPSAYRSIILS